MLNGLFIFFILLSSKVAYGQEDITKDVDVYVNITQVYAPDGTKGTSTPLNILVSNQAQSTGTLEHKFHRIASPRIYTGEITVYDWSNIMHKQGFRKCDYVDAVRCGIANNHWTLQTVVTVGKKFSTITMKLYNEKGVIVANGSKTSYGKIRWKPQWKLTKVKESGGFGGEKSTEIFEMWPPKMEELPPLLRPYHVHQAMQHLFLSVKNSSIK